MLVNVENEKLSLLTQSSQFSSKKMNWILNKENYSLVLFRIQVVLKRWQYGHNSVLIISLSPHVIFISLISFSVQNGVKTMNLWNYLFKYSLITFDWKDFAVEYFITKLSLPLLIMFTSLHCKYIREMSFLICRKIFIVIIGFRLAL
jgi:hypothetical protein